MRGITRYHEPELNLLLSLKVADAVGDAVPLGRFSFYLQLRLWERGKVGLQHARVLRELEPNALTLDYSISAVRYLIFDRVDILYGGISVSYRELVFDFRIIDGRKSWVGAGFPGDSLWGSARALRKWANNVALAPMMALTSATRSFCSMSDRPELAATYSIAMDSLRVSGWAATC